MKVLHLWDSYAPGLFDRSFEICRAEDIETRLACMHLIERGETAHAGVSYVRRLDREDGSLSFASRIRRKQRLLIDRSRFRRLVRRTIREFDPNLIHVHYGTTAVLLARARDGL